MRKFYGSQKCCFVKLHIIKTQNQTALQVYDSIQQFFSVALPAILYKSFRNSYTARKWKKRELFSFTVITNFTMPSAKIIFHYYANYNENMVKFCLEPCRSISWSFSRHFFPLCTKINFHCCEIINSNTDDEKLWKLITWSLLTSPVCFVSSSASLVLTSQVVHGTICDTIINLDIRQGEQIEVFSQKFLWKVWKHLKDWEKIMKIRFVHKITRFLKDLIS